MTVLHGFYVKYSNCQGITVICDRLGTVNIILLFRATMVSF